MNFDLNYIQTGEIGKFLTKKLPRLAPFAGGMKFATQIWPLLDFYLNLIGILFLLEFYFFVKVETENSLGDI